MTGLIARKIDQTQRFLEDGTRIPVTVLDVTDNTVVSVKTPEKDHYTALQLGFGARRKATKATLGHAKKAKLEKAPWIIKEIRLSDSDTLMNPGDTLKAADTFKAGDIIQVTGFSKGKGFAGGVKRYGFKGGPRTHGQSDRERAPGSIGQTTTPGRVYKGKRMAGRMGQDKVTIANLIVVDVDDTTKTLHVKGLIPGYTGSYVTVVKTGELSEKKFVPLLTDKKDEPQVEEPSVEASTQDEAKVEEVEKVENNEETKVEVTAQDANGEEVETKPQDEAKVESVENNEATQGTEAASTESSGEPKEGEGK